MSDEQSKAAAVYVSFPTFKAALDTLSESMPHQVDKSIFPTLSGGVQSQLIAGLKFLGLILDDGTPTQDLLELTTTDEVKRKEKLKQILKTRYSELFAMDLTKVTPTQLRERMGAEYNVSGDTREKALRFFLAAISYVGEVISKYIKIPGAPSNGNKPRKRTTSRKPVQAQEEDEEDVETPGKGTSKMVVLNSGGTLTVTASLDLFMLTPDDRQFVFDLIDKLSEYEKKNLLT